ncbi:LPD16 domain-containing protein [Pseudomonas capeferrum]|uniref:LPD16 domain-containing protein n=1 Tax=Pseudomonas capeferrum TaxID=1495066 RepID=UPI00397A5D50
MRKITIHENCAFTEEELKNNIHNFMNAEPSNSAHIMAGHFMLFYDKQSDRLIPGVFEDIEDPTLKTQIKERVGIFPTYSWMLAIELAEHHIVNNNKSANLLLLINDWQYVPSDELTYDYRAEFYNRFKELPASYLAHLNSSSIVTTKNITSSRRHTLCFPETWLKNRFQNEASRLVKQGKLKKRYIPEQPEMSEISFTDASGTSLPLVSCGMTGCAGEITEMISEAYRAGARLLILLAPNECHAPIRKGVEIALSLYDFDPVSVLVADLGGSGEFTTEEIYSKGIHIVTYRT